MPVATFLNDLSLRVGVAGYTAGTGSLTLATGQGALITAQLSRQSAAALSADNPVQFAVVKAGWAYSPAAGPTVLTRYQATGLTGDTLTGLTAVEGTTDRDYIYGDIVDFRPSAAGLSAAGTAAADAVTLTGSQTVSGAKTLTNRLTQTAPADNVLGVLSPQTADPTTGADFYVSIVPQSNAGLGGTGYDLVYTAGWNMIQSTLVDSSQHGAGTSIEYGWYNGPDSTRQTEFHSIRFVKSNGDGTGTEYRALTSVSPWNDPGNIATDFTANTWRISDERGRIFVQVTSTAAASDAVVQFVFTHPNGSNIFDIYGNSDTTGQVNIGGTGNTVLLRLVDSLGDGRIVLTPGPDPYIQFAGSTTPSHPQISFADDCNVYAYGGNLTLYAAKTMYHDVHTGQSGLIIRDADNGSATIATVDGNGVSAVKAVRPGNGTALGPGLWGGTGVPDNAIGANGDYYFRSDGTVAGSTLTYHKESGSWSVVTSGAVKSVAGRTDAVTLAQADIAGLTASDAPSFASSKFSIDSNGNISLNSNASYYANAIYFNPSKTAAVYYYDPDISLRTFADGKTITLNTFYNRNLITLSGYVVCTNGAPAQPAAMLTGAASQTAPLLKLRQLISSTAYDTGIIDTGWINSTPATRTGYLDSLAPDYTGTNKRGTRTWSDAVYGRHQISAPPSAPTDAELLNSMLTVYQDEGSSTLIFRVRRSDGTYGKVTLTVTPG